MAAPWFQPLRTLASIATSELRLTSRRFSLWFLVALAFALGYVFCTPWVRLFSGDGPQTQTVPLARNSAYALSMAMTGLAFLLAPFVASISAESAVRDVRVRLLPLALVTPVSRTTYLLAKCAAAVAASIAPLLAFLGGVAVAQVVSPNERLLMPANVVGPLAAFLHFGLPFVCAIAIVSFSLSTSAAEPKRAYVVVTLIGIAELALYASAGRPEFAWLSNVDPLGLLPLLDVGAGGLTNVELSQVKWPGGLTFSLNRFALVAAASLFVIPAARALPSVGASAVPAAGRRVAVPAVGHLFSRAIGAAAEFVPPLRLPGPLALVGAVAVAELRLLMHEQSLLFFLPLFAGLVWLNMGQPIGPFNIEAVPVTSILAQQNVWIVVGALFVLGVFLITESSLRDRDIKIHDLIRLNPISPAIALGGKLLANALIAATLLVLAAVLVALYQVVYGGGPVRLLPLFHLYGLIALTTVVAGQCLALLIATISQSRHASYALLVIVIGLYAYGWFYGYQHWLYNLPALDLFVYADGAGFGLITSTLLVHRAYVVAVAAFLFWAAVYLSVRRDTTAQASPGALLATGAALAAVSAVLGGTIAWRIHQGAWSNAAAAARAEYERVARPWLPAKLQPSVTRVSLDLDLYPERQAFALRGANVLENTHTVALEEVHVTVNPRLIANGWIELDGRRPQTLAPGLFHFRLDRPLAPGASATLRYAWTGKAPDGVPPNGDRYTTFVDTRGTLLSSMFGWGWLPFVGYNNEAELLGSARRTHGLKVRTLIDPLAKGETSPVGFMRRNVPHWYAAKIRAPREQRVVSTGRLVTVRELGERREYEYTSDTPIHLIAVMAGRWVEKTRGSNSVLYDPQHPYNADVILETMEASRALYSSIYGPYPFSTLTTAEIPQMGVWGGIAFPGLIPLSDDMAFLTRESARRANLNAFTVAHEIAHEWWGQSVWPAHARGSSSLTEGLATYSALLSIERSLGEQRRRAIFEDLEYFYLRNRRPDQEQSLADLDGTRNDTAIKYHRAGIVFYMLSQRVGVERFLATLGEFSQRYAFTREHPTFLGLLRSIEARAPEVKPFVDDFIRGTAVPRIEYSDVALSERAGGRWVATFTLTNTGTGTIELEVAARGRPRGDARTRVAIAPRASVAAAIESSFRPVLLQFDPDTTVLLQNRSDSIYRF